MKNPIASPNAQNLGLFLAGVPLGVFIGVGGYTTVTCGLKNYVDANVADALRFLPSAVARGYLAAVPFAEIFVGALVVFGLFTRIGAFLGSLLLVGFTLTGGVKWMQAGPFNQNIVFLGMALALMTIGPGKLSADGLMFGPKGEKKH